MAAQTYPTVSSKVGNYNVYDWGSLFNLRWDEGYLEEISRYGLGSHFYDFLKLSDMTINITTRTPKVFETLEWEPTVKLGTAIATTAAGADISFDIHADDIDTQGQIPVQVNDRLVIPAAYETNNRNAIYHITDITGTTVTAAAVSADGTGGAAQSQIAVAVPIGTTLKINANAYAYGTGQPDGFNQVRAQREYNTQLIKTSMGYEGGIQAIKWREIKSESGINSAWMEGQEIAERIHSKKCDDALFLGETNDNALLVQTSSFGGSNPIPSTKGLWNWAEDAGQDLLYAGQWDAANLYDYKDLALSQNLTATEVLFLMGTDLQRMVEESNLDWIKSYSGGSDLFRTAYEIGIDVRSFKANGYHFLFQELKSFANPLRWGNKDYEFTKYGLMIPNGNYTYTIDGMTERFPQLIMAFLNNNGENRERIIRIADGMSGRTNTAINDIDGSHLWMLTEMATIVYRPNQLVRVMPQ